MSEKIPAKACVKSIAEDIKDEYQESNCKGRVFIAEENEMTALLMEAHIKSFDIQSDILSNGDQTIEAVKTKITPRYLCMIKCLRFLEKKQQGNTRV